MVLGGEGCDTARERLGKMMPSSDSDNDLRLVLYGMATLIRLSQCRQRGCDIP